MGEKFEGEIDEIRLWSRVLDGSEILSDYTRYLIGNERNLDAYYTFDFMSENQIYDSSFEGKATYHGNTGSNFKVQKIKSHLSTNRLSYCGVTDSSGVYNIRSVPYYGNGTAYTIIPRKGTHQFSPKQEIRFIGEGAQHHTVNFTDNSSFAVSGTIYYAGGTYPVEGVHFTIDGAIALNKSGQYIMTDADGNFTINVPVGTHEVKAVKDGHTFELDGRICNSDGSDRNYQDVVTGLKLYDNTKIKELEQELELYTFQEGETDNKKAQCQVQLVQLEKRKNNLLENQKFAEEELGRLAQQAKETDGQKGALLEKEAQLITEVQNSRMELHGIETQNESVMQTAEKAKADLETAKGYLATAQGELDEILSFAEEVQRKITQNTNIKNGITLKLNGTNEKLEKANEALSANSQKQFETNNRIRILTDMENNLDGFQQSVKNILTNGKNGRLKGIIGTVAQLIGVEKGYETAIEIALGNYGLQNIVVQDESSAKQAIEFLKNNKAGRATFLPLDTVKAASFNENLPEWATTADKVITVDARYSHIISSLLGRTVICDDINAASRLAKQLNYRYKIVTKDGQQINAGGSFTGGSVSKSAGLFTRKGEIEKLKENSVDKSQYNKLLEEKEKPLETIKDSREAYKKWNEIKRPEKSKH